MRRKTLIGALMCQLLCSLFFAACQQTPANGEQELILSETQLQLIVGEQFTLSCNVEKGVKWSSENSDVAEVNGGVVTAIDEGTAKVYAEFGGQKKECTVVIEERPAPTDPLLLLSNSQIFLRQNEQYRLTVFSNRIEEEIVWQTSDEKVAKVNADGVVTAVASGSATVTATAGKYQDVCTVSVEEDVLLVLPKEQGKFVEGETYSLQYLFLIDDREADSEKLTWKSSNEEILTVQNGQITAVSTGNAMVTVSYGALSRNVSCDIWSPIRTVEDFEALRNKRDEDGNIVGKYLLTNDLDFGGKTFEGFCPNAETGSNSSNGYAPQHHYFAATLDGNGYAIRNMTVAMSGIVGAMGKQGVIRNLELDQITTWQEGTMCSGLVTCNLGTIENIKMDFSVPVTSPKINCNTPIASLVIDNRGIIRNCFVELTLPEEVTYDGSRGALAVGAVVGKIIRGGSNISDCYVVSNHTQYDGKKILITSYASAAAQETNTAVVGSMAEFYETVQDAYLHFDENVWIFDGTNVPELKKG